MTTPVSHSQADTWLVCQRKWLYSYGRKLQRQTTSSPLRRGTAAHAVLEAYYRAIMNGYTHEAALEVAHRHYDNIAQNPEALGDEFGPGGTIKNLSLYSLLFDWYFEFEPFATKGYEILAVEYDSVLEYDGGSFPYVVDLIVRDPNGQIAVVDHKVQYDFLTDQDVDVQPQIKKYIGALRAEGLPADYGIYNQLRYRKLKDPTRTSTLAVHVFHPNDTEIYTNVREQIEVATRINEFKALDPEQQSLQALRVGYKKICQSCDFLLLCTEEKRGGNTALILSSEYQTKPKRTDKTEALLDNAKEE